MKFDNPKFVLTEHPSITAISFLERDALVKELSNIKDPDRHLKRTNSESNTLSIYDKVMELDNSLNSLQQSLNNMTKELSATEPDVEEFRYHLENYFFRLSGFYDRSIILTGFWIGMDERSLSRMGTKQKVSKYIKDNKLSSVSDKLEILEKLVIPYRKYRNEIAHESQLSSLGIGLFSSAMKFRDTLPTFNITMLFKEHFQEHVDDYQLLKSKLQEACYDLITLLSNEFDLINFINSHHKP